MAVPRVSDAQTKLRPAGDPTWHYQVESQAVNQRESWEMREIVLRVRPVAAGLPVVNSSVWRRRLQVGGCRYPLCRLPADIYKLVLDLENYWQNLGSHWFLF